MFFGFRWQMALPRFMLLWLCVMGGELLEISDAVLCCYSRESMSVCCSNLLGSYKVNSSSAFWRYLTILNAPFLKTVCVRALSQHRLMEVTASVSTALLVECEFRVGLEDGGIRDRKKVAKMPRELCL